MVGKPIKSTSKWVNFPYYERARTVYFSTNAIVRKYRTDTISFNILKHYTHHCIAINRSNHEFPPTPSQIKSYMSSVKS